MDFDEVFVKNFFLKKFLEDMSPFCGATDKSATGPHKKDSYSPKKFKKKILYKYFIKIHVY